MNETSSLTRTCHKHSTRETRGMLHCSVLSAVNEFPDAHDWNRIRIRTRCHCPLPPCSLCTVVHYLAYLAVLRGVGEEFPLLPGDSTRGDKLAVTAHLSPCSLCTVVHYLAVPGCAEGCWRRVSSSSWRQHQE
jgi:hypothetical protein